MGLLSTRPSRPGPRRASVRTHLLVLTLACVLPAAAGVAGTITLAYKECRRAEMERAASIAVAMMRAVDAELERATLGLQVLAQSPSLQRGDISAFRAEALKTLPFQAGNNLVLSDPLGQQRMNTLLSEEAPLPRHNNPQLLQRVLQEGKPLVSDLFIGGVTRRPLVAVEVPVFVNEQPAFGLAMGFFPDRLASLVAGLRPRAEWVVSVFDSQGTIVARTHLPERFVGKKGAPELMAAMARANQGVLELETLEGLPVVAAYTRSPSSRWAVAVGVPREELLAALHRWVAWLAVGTLSLLVFALLGASLISRRIAHAISALIPPASALGRGEPLRVQALPIREAEAVANELHAASLLLQKRTIERDVASHRAEHDLLTGLANRGHFLERVQQLVSQGEPFVVLFIDLDDFKPVNDRYGHAVGDELLRSFAGRLAAAVRDSDLVARLGGDEFAVALAGLREPAARLGEALLERLSQPYAIRHQEIKVSACIGLASFPRDGGTAEAVLEAADAAMYRAKSSGKRMLTSTGFGDL